VDDSLDLRPIDADEFPAFGHSMYQTFGGDLRDDDLEADRWVFEPDRSLATFADKRVVSTAAIFSRRMTVPGGELPVAAVTMVSVSPTHRRQGILRSMMRRQLTELHDEGREPVAALWASEGTIYGRFGYGLAARRARFTGDTQSLTVPRDADDGAGRMRMVSLDEARPHLASIYDAVRTGQNGWLDRPGRWWDHRLYDPSHARSGATALRCAIYEQAEGAVAGYVVYRIKEEWGDAGNQSVVQVQELTATTPQAYAATWRFILDLDLIRRVVKRIVPVDEPLQHIVTDPNAVQLSVSAGLWVRLVDVDRALSARRYATDVDVVLDVTDDFCPWNSGRLRLSAGPQGAACTPTKDAPDLELAAVDLGAAYLGGTTLQTLAAAGRVRERRPGALLAASQAFAGAREPWCPEVF
jgi:predicted acetyltransferase